MPLIHFISKSPVSPRASEDFSAEEADKKASGRMEKGDAVLLKQALRTSIQGAGSV